MLYKYIFLFVLLFIICKTNAQIDATYNVLRLNSHKFDNLIKIEKFDFLTVYNNILFMKYLENATR